MRPKPVRLVDAEGIDPSETIRTRITAFPVIHPLAIAGVVAIGALVAPSFGQKGTAPTVSGSPRMSAPPAAAPRVAPPAAPRVSAPPPTVSSPPRVSAPPPRVSSPPPPRVAAPPKAPSPGVSFRPPSGRVDTGARPTRPPTVVTPDVPRSRTPAPPTVPPRGSPNFGSMPNGKPSVGSGTGGRVGSGTPSTSTPTSTTRTRTFDGGRPLPKPVDVASPTKSGGDLAAAPRTGRPPDRTAGRIAPTDGRASIVPTGRSPGGIKGDPRGLPPRDSLPPVPPPTGGDLKVERPPTTKVDLPDLSTGRGQPPPRDRPSGDPVGNGDTIVVNGDVFVNNGTVNVWNAPGCGSWWYPETCGYPAWNWCGGAWGGPWWNTCGGWSAGWSGGWGSGWSLGFAFGSGGFGFSLGYSSGWGGYGWPGPCYAGVPAWGGWYGWNGGCTPWWSASISLVNCGWYPSIPCWNPCGPWWGGYAWSPYAAWAPYPAVVAVTVPIEPATVVTVVEPTPVPVTPLAPIAPMGAVESEAWALLSEGFPETAAGLFASLHDDRPDDPRPLAGYAIALANLGDTAGAAATLRRALAIDASVLGRLPVSPELAGRLQSLESAARVTTRQAAATADAYFLLACWRTMLGRSTEAHFAATLAVEKGDGSAGTARFRDWLANVG